MINHNKRKLQTQKMKRSWSFGNEGCIVDIRTTDPFESLWSCFSFFIWNHVVSLWIVLDESIKKISRICYVVSRDGCSATRTWSIFLDGSFFSKARRSSLYTTYYHNCYEPNADSPFNHCHAGKETVYSHTICIQCITNDSFCSLFMDLSNLVVHRNVSHDSSRGSHHLCY